MGRTEAGRAVRCTELSSTIGTSTVSGGALVVLPAEGRHELRRALVSVPERILARTRSLPIVPRLLGGLALGVITGELHDLIFGMGGDNAYIFHLPAVLLAALAFGRSASSVTLLATVAWITLDLPPRGSLALSDPEDVVGVLIYTGLAGSASVMIQALLHQRARAEEAERAERVLRERETELRVVLAELQHRTRNLLGVVRAIAVQTLPESDALQEYAARLAAIGRVQGFLARSAAWSAPLHEVVEAELRAVGKDRPDRVTVDGPPVSLGGETVQLLALALHELATNALKYGALAQPDARLSVTWRLEGAGEERRLVLDWRESGVQMPEGGQSTRRGYGSELIERALPYQLRAQTRLEFMREGVRCKIGLPLT